jgi:hypothetical protein
MMDSSKLPQSGQTLKIERHVRANGKTVQFVTAFIDNSMAGLHRFVHFVIGALLVMVKQAQFFYACLNGKL